MNQESVVVLMRAAAPVIAGFVSQEVVKATAPLIARIAELEARPVPERGEKGEPGERGEPGHDGRSVTVDEVASLIAGEIAKAVSEIPVPEKGEKGDKGEDAAPPGDDQIAAAVAEYLTLNPPPQGEKGEPGQDGVSYPKMVESVELQVLKVFAEYIEKNPPIKGDKGEPGENGSDGIGLAGALIDREGVLHLTMTDGESKALGIVVGNDGEPGKDGCDGFSPEDFKAELKDDGRTLVVSLVRGEHVKSCEVVFPIVLDRGVWKEGPFQKGDGVTWNGSFFIAQRDTEEKPEQSKDWRLAVKRGRDGKDGVMKSAPELAPIKFK